MRPNGLTKRDRNIASQKMASATAAHAASIGIPEDKAMAMGAFAADVMAKSYAKAATTNVNMATPTQPGVGSVGGGGGGPPPQRPRPGITAGNNRNRNNKNK